MPKIVRKHRRRIGSLLIAMLALAWLVQPLYACALGGGTAEHGDSGCVEMPLCDCDAGAGVDSSAGSGHTCTDMSATGTHADEILAGTEKRLWIPASVPVALLQRSPERREQLGILPDRDGASPASHPALKDCVLRI